MADRRALHAQALADADTAIHSLRQDELDRPSACAGWPVRELVAHMTGQNVGFAEAIATGDAALDRYLPRGLDEWPTSVGALRTATASPSSQVHLVEVAPGAALPVDRVLGIHALDLAVHTWDIDGTHRPADELAELVLTLARAIPPRTTAGGQFDPALTCGNDDPWKSALALLGRDAERTRG